MFTVIVYFKNFNKKYHFLWKNNLIGGGILNKKFQE